jgi:hypothetical protein
MAAGNNVGEGFNDSLWIFPSKGSQDDDSATAVKRGAADTRPLSLKNTDNKSLAGTVNAQLAEPISNWADEVQEGFVRGRQALNNVCTVDAHSRALDAIAHSAAKLSISQAPLLLLFDLAAAFPSIAHSFIFAVLEFYGFPTGLLLFFRQLYNNNVCYATIEGQRVLLYTILSGILQGCPASGSLFVLAVDPFYRMVKARIAGSRSKAFADDLATIIQKFSQIPLIKQCFDVLESVSGLALKPKKCVLIILGRDVDEAVMEEARAYLIHILPDWAKFRIETSGVYLGFRVGPSGGTCASWETPLLKYKDRANELGAAGLAPSLGARFYAMNVAPTLSYVEQLCEPTSALRIAEKSALEKVMHAPHNSFPGNAAFLLDQAGLVPLRSIVVRGEAARYRTALRTCTCWREEWQSLSATRVEHGPMANRAVCDPKLLKDYPRWDSEAFVDVLARAASWDLDTSLDVSAKSLQAAAAKCIAISRFPADLASEIAPRLHRFLAPETFPLPYLITQIRITLGVARNMAPSVRWA